MIPIEITVDTKVKGLDEHDGRQVCETHWKLKKFVRFSGLFVGVERWDFRGSSRNILLSTTN